MDEQGGRDGARPGSIAAELGNGDPNGRRVERRAEQAQEATSKQQQRSSRADLAAATEQELGARTVPSRHGRELFIPPCHKLKYRVTAINITTAKGGPYDT